MTSLNRPLESSWVSRVTLGSNDPVKTAAYLAAYGHTSSAAPDIVREAARGLYGLDGPLRQIVARPSDLSGEIQIIGTPNQPKRMEPFQAGYHGLDFYTSDIGHSRDVAIAAGGVASNPTVYAAGKASILESRILAKDLEYALYITEVADRPFPSALDSQPKRQYSDIVTVVAFVDERDVEAETEFWTKNAGLELFRKDLEFDGDSMQALMDLPSKATMGAVQFCDRRRRRRLELLFYRDTDAVRSTSAQLSPGLHSIGFPVADLDRAVKAFSDVTFCDAQTVDCGHGSAATVSALSPSGLRFELFEASE